MAFVKHYDGDQPPVKHLPCIHLRSKGLFVSGEWKKVDDPDEAGVDHCWCNQTQHILGPDDQFVGQRECQPNRNCYRQTY